MKKTIFLLSVLAIVGYTSFAQQFNCYTDQMHWQKVKEHPEILDIERNLNAQIQEGLKKINLSNVAHKTTSSETDTTEYVIPIVIHVVHDYGNEDVTDSALISYVKLWNTVYNKQNPDSATVLAQYRGFIPNSHVPYIGNMHITLRLATKDPFGNPTHGITRRLSYLTHYAGENAKFDDWPPSSYLNIWVINTFSQAEASAAAYAIEPPTAAVEPWADGFISVWSYLGVSYVANHEMTHLFNVYHTFGNTNNAAVMCGDDEVDDTPPTEGHLTCGTAQLYDTACATGYLKVYPSSVVGIDSLVDYPDTVNTENIMDYSFCSKMFTSGQCDRVHQCLQNAVANRNNLWIPANLSLTGTDVSSSWPDLAPVPDFSVDNDYPCIGTLVTFTNHSWNDTVKKIEWSFSNGGTSIYDSTHDDKYFSTPTSAVGHTAFTQPGWVTVTMTATGNGTAGTGTLVDAQRIFVADTAPTVANGYVQEFNSSGDVNKWPMFNYYNNEFKWQIANVGYNDNVCVQYTGYDNRINIAQNLYPLTGVPRGDHDDMYTPYFDVSTLTGGTQPSLNFMYSGATRSANAADINDSLEIWYSINTGGCNPPASWYLLTSFSKASLCNKGSLSTPYTPSGPGDWVLKSVPLNKTGMSSAKKISFRFRYRPGINSDGYVTTEGYSTGNNFYIDRINFSSSPLGLNTLLPNEDHAVVVAPNPTNGDAYVIIIDDNNVNVRVTITDISGRLIYTAQQQTTGSITNITIPKSALPIGGMYLVNVATPNQTHTEKLVVY